MYGKCRLWAQVFGRVAGIKGNPMGKNREKYINNAEIIGLAHYSIILQVNYVGIREDQRAKGNRKRRGKRSNQKPKNKEKTRKRKEKKSKPNGMQMPTMWTGESRTLLLI